MNTFLSCTLAVCGTLLFFIVLLKFSSKYCHDVKYHGLGSLSSPLISTNSSSSTSVRTVSCEQQDSYFTDIHEKNNDIMIKQHMSVVQKAIEHTRHNRNYYDIETGNPKFRSSSV